MNFTLTSKMSMKYFPPEKGERSIGTGKSVGIVDCSAEEVAAWVMDYCSNERMRISTEERNPARLELREKGEQGGEGSQGVRQFAYPEFTTNTHALAARVNEACFATIKKFPFLLDNREFVFRHFWKSEEGKVSIAVESIDDEVDYGVKLGRTRGFVRAFWKIEDLPVRGGAKQCRVMFVQYLDFGGFLPTWLVDKKVLKSLAIVQRAIEEFRQVGLVSRATEIEEPVEECSWVFVGISFFFTSAFTLFCICVA